jgi:hypothetical protein
VPGTRGGDHPPCGPKTAAGKCKHSIEKVGGERTVWVEGAESSVDAKHEITLDEYEGWFGVKEIEHGVEGCFEFWEVLQ